MSDYVIDSERPWLGGSLVGGDPATFYPELWEWLINKLGISSVIDVGCGEGYALGWFADNDVDDLLGIDGINQIDQWSPPASFFTHDYTAGPLDDIGEYDLAWCCEFVEHVEEQYVPNFLATFKCARWVAMTHGTPGQPGHHHVNNQVPNYWKGALAAAGFRYDQYLTMQARMMAAHNTHPSNHFVRSGLVFAKND